MEKIEITENGKNDRRNEKLKTAFFKKNKKQKTYFTSMI